jgi:hypothetical protein
MTAKTILVQLHHKVSTFEHLNKHLVLVLQEQLLDYMKKEFSFSHLSQPAKIGDSMHFHSYKLERHNKNDNYSIKLKDRLSTDNNGIATAMGLKADAKIELDMIIKSLESKISEKTLLTL